MGLHDISLGMPPPNHCWFTLEEDSQWEDETYRGDPISYPPYTKPNMAPEPSVLLKYCLAWHGCRCSPSPWAGANAKPSVAQHCSWAATKPMSQLASQPATPLTSGPVQFLNCPVAVPEVGVLSVHAQRTLGRMRIYPPFVFKSNFSANLSLQRHLLASMWCWSIDLAILLD